MYEVKTLSHTADIRLYLSANTLEDLFLAAITSMGNILREDHCTSGYHDPISRYVELSAPDVTVLLIDFLSEVLTLTHSEKTIFCTMKIQYLDEQKIRAFIYGHRVNSFDEDIKAVTYHEAEVTLNHDGLYHTRLIFDI